MYKLSEQGMVEKTRIRNVERDISRVDGERAEHASDIAGARTNISEKELQRFQIHKDFDEGVIKDLRKVQAEVFDYLQRINASQIRSSTNRNPLTSRSTVVDTHIHTPGGVVGPRRGLDGDRTDWGIALW